MFNSTPFARTIQGWALITLLPGVALAVSVGVSSHFAAQILSPYLAIPAMVLALVIGIPLNVVAALPYFAPGLKFCVRTVLRWAVALLGLRIALSDITSLGMLVALIVLAGMTITIASGFLIARLAKQPAGFGALAGVATGICGASATLAVSTVVPHYTNKQTDIVFVVIAVNALSTIAMLTYPPLCVLLGLDPQSTGILLGGTIHDVAQVVGSGYSVSEAVGNTAVIVKLFRVFMLLPIVLCIAWYFSRKHSAEVSGEFEFPMFAVAFLVLCLFNSAISFLPQIQPLYLPLKDALLHISSWGLLIAIAALGLGTSIKAISAVGARHLMTITGTTLVLLLSIIIMLSVRSALI